jgi:hypothetical protein
MSDTTEDLDGGLAAVDLYWVPLGAGQARRPAERQAVRGYQRVAPAASSVRPVPLGARRGRTRRPFRRRAPLPRVAEPEDRGDPEPHPRDNQARKLLKAEKD